MDNKFVGFDLEIAEPFPEGGWDRESSLGISCAALHDGHDTVPFYPAMSGDRLGDRMSPEEVRGMIDAMVALENDGKYIVTWNGMGFDFLVLAIECQDAEYRKIVSEMALRHIDPFFNMFCDKGCGIGLQTAAVALGVQGKLEGMHGSLAPLMWNAGFPVSSEEDIRDIELTGRARGSLDAQNLCIFYVEQDAVATYDIYAALLNTHMLYWTTKAGRRTRSPWYIAKNDGRLLTCLEANDTPVPNTSWMTDRFRQKGQNTSGGRKMNNIKPIRTDEDFRAAITRINEIWDADDGTDEYNELDVLMLMIESYERVYYELDISDIDPIEYLEFHMDRLGLYMKDLMPYIGTYSEVIDVLERRTLLTLQMIRNLANGLNINPGPLVKMYYKVAK